MHQRQLRRNPRLQRDRFVAASLLPAFPAVLTVVQIKLERDLYSAKSRERISGDEYELMLVSYMKQFGF